MVALVLLAIQSIPENWFLDWLKVLGLSKLNILRLAERTLLLSLNQVSFLPGGEKKVMVDWVLALAVALTRQEG